MKLKYFPHNKHHFLLKPNPKYVPDVTFTKAFY